MVPSWCLLPSQPPKLAAMECAVIGLSAGNMEDPWVIAGAGFWLGRRSCGFVGLSAHSHSVGGFFLSVSESSLMRKCRSRSALQFPWETSPLRYSEELAGYACSRETAFFLTSSLVDWSLEAWALLSGSCCSTEFSEQRSYSTGRNMCAVHSHCPSWAGGGTQPWNCSPGGFAEVG